MIKMNFTLELKFMIVINIQITVMFAYWDVFFWYRFVAKNLIQRTMWYYFRNVEFLDGKSVRLCFCEHENFS